MEPPKSALRQQLIDPQLNRRVKICNTRFSLIGMQGSLAAQVSGSTFLYLPPVEKSRLCRHH